MIISSKIGSTSGPSAALGKETINGAARVTTSFADTALEELFLVWWVDPWPTDRFHILKLRMSLA